MGQGSGQALSLLVFLFLARYVSQSSFGLVAVSLTVVEFLRRLLIDPVTVAVYSRPDVADEDYDTCFIIILALGSVSAAILFLLAQPVATLLGSAEAGPALQLISLLLFGYGLSGTPGAWLARQMKFRALAVRSTFSVTAGGVVGVSMALNGWQLWSLVGQQFTIATVNVVALWVGAGWRPRLRFSWLRIRGLGRRARPISFGALWTSIASDSDLIFVAGYFGPVAAALYSAAKRIMLAANLVLVSTVSTLTLPTLANLETSAQRGAAFRSGMMLTSAVCAPAFGGLAIIAPDLVKVLLGDSWARSAPVLMALAASGYFLSLNQLSSSMLVVAQRAHLDSLCSAIWAVLNICMFLLAAQFGPLALAVAFSATTLLILPIRLRFALREAGLGVGAVLHAVLPSQSAAIVMMIILWSIREISSEWMSPIVLLPTLVGAGMLIYCAAMRLCAPRLFALLLEIVSAVARRDRVGGQGMLA